MFLPQFRNQSVSDVACEEAGLLQRFFTRLFKQEVVLLAGPTCSGKTAVSLWLAEMLGGEIVSVDSVQVYRGMDIGTAKVSLETRAQVPHHLIDICHVQEPFNATDFFYQAVQACYGILERNKVPILVGGTGFYFHTFLAGVPKGPSPDPEFRSQLSAHMQEVDVASVYAELCEKDPVYAATITKNDKNKIIRALEILHLTGKKVSDHQWSPVVQSAEHFDCFGWFLSPPQELLKENIRVRCEQMLEEGLIKEVLSLLDQGIKDNPSASKAIGYREWIEFIEMGLPDSLFDSVKAKFISNSQRYTKKQRTWFKRYPIFRPLPTLGLSPEAIAEIIARDYLQKNPS